MKKEIERVAPTLRTNGEMGYVNIPRRCRVVRANVQGTYVSCQHGRPEPLRAASEFVTGMYMLIDEGACASADSERGRRSFISAVVSACNQIASGVDDVAVEWLDEWPISRGRRNGSFVDVVAVWGAFSVPAAVSQTLWKAIQDGQRKFHRRWAARHILLLDSVFYFTDVDRVREVLEDVPQSDFAIAYRDIDEVVLYWHRKIWPVYRKPTTAAALT